MKTLLQKLFERKISLLNNMRGYEAVIQQYQKERDKSGKSEIDKADLVNKLQRDTDEQLFIDGLIDYVISNLIRPNA